MKKAHLKKARLNGNPDARGNIGILIINHFVSAQPGRDIVKEILPIQPQMEVLRFSGHLEQDLRASGEIRPDSFFIQKPFTLKQLITKVGEIAGPR